MDSAKILFFDLDGTLAHRNLPPSDADLSALRRAKERGHKICLCTGRAPGQLYDAILKIGFDGIIASAGVYVSVGGTVLHEAVLPFSIIEQAIQFFYDADVTGILEAFGGLYVINDGEGKFSCWSSADMADFRPPNGKLCGERVHKCTVYRAVGDDVRRVLGNDMDIIEHGHFIEVVPHGYDKSTGIKMLMDHLGIPRENSIAFGDSANDIGMLNAVSIGIAMGNASPAVLKAASRVTTPFSESGVAQAILELEREGVL